MIQSVRRLAFVSFALGALAASARGDSGPTPALLAGRIDALIEAGRDAKEMSPAVDDSGFVRRVYLDLAGRIPSADETRAFLADTAPDKRAALIDRILNSDDYPRRMAELVNVMLMERLGENSDWSDYLRRSFAANIPWDRIAREVLDARTGAAPQGASFFIAQRLTNYGQNPVDYPALTRDVGRMFLGIDLRCAQCHDHLFIDDYKQADFQGLSAFFQNAYLADPKSLTVAEKPTTRKVAYSSVFKKVPKEIGPRVPGQEELTIPSFPKGQEFATPPDPKTSQPGRPKFSPLAELSARLPAADNRAFVRNAVNRLWFVMMGRGLVHPLDLHHADNPPSHPALLDLLADEFVASKFDVKALLRALARTRTYQRSSELPPGASELPPESFLTALEKRLSAEQLFASALQATGTPAPEGKAADALRAKFVKAFANPPREAEDEFSPSVKGALFVANDESVLGLLAPKDGNLIGRLNQLTDPDAAAEELYLSVLTRRPDANERAEVADYLKAHAGRRAEALGHLAWALLASTEFCVNH